MTSRDQLLPARTPEGRVRIECALPCPAHFYRYLYGEVGRAHHWTDRLSWSDEAIRDHLARAFVFVMYAGGAPAGYFELQPHDDGSVEIAYFGLLPEFKGRGLGKHLLTVAVEEAWDRRPARVWLHTCTLDDPAAMPNYRKRGFRPFKQETYWIETE